MDRARRCIPVVMVVWFTAGVAAALPPKPVKDPTIQNKPLSDWITQLKAKDVALRRSAVAAIEQLPKVLESAKLTEDSATLLFQALIAALLDNDEAVRVNAVTFLCGMNRVSGKKKLGDADKARALAILLDATKHASSAIRFKAATHLTTIERRDKIVLGPLVTLLNDPEFTVRLGAVEGLGDVTPAQAVVPPLIDALADREARVRAAAAYALGSVSGSMANAFSQRAKTKATGATKAPVPPLLAALKDPDPIVRRAAAWALARFGSAAQAIVPNLITALKDPDAGVRGTAAESLGLFRETAKSAVPLLLDMVKGKVPEDRFHALRSLVAIDPAGQQTMTVLLAALDDEELRGTALRRIRSLGPKAKAAIPALLRLMKAKEVEVREEALQTLVAIDPVGEQTMTALIAALDDKEVRITALGQIRSLGPKAKAAVPALLRLAKDKDEEVRSLVESTLKRVNREAAKKPGVP